jgi:hypothetical protein
MPKQPARKKYIHGTYLIVDSVLAQLHKEFVTSLVLHIILWWKFKWVWCQFLKCDPSSKLIDYVKFQALTADPEFSLVIE